MDLIELQAYVEKRFDLLSQESDFRHSAAAAQVAAALAASKEAILKAEMATNARFEAGNKIRNAMIDRERMFIPRAEVLVMEAAAMNRIAAIEKQVENMMSERAGVRGGWGYAVGLIGVIALLVTLALRILGKG